ncbi:MAG: COX15/CtaA family protein, partial [Acidimicrobiales bacterium]
MAPPPATVRYRLVDAYRALRYRRLSPARFQTIAGLSVWALALLIVTGAAVRLTGSGLGCADWPNCTRSDLIAPLQFHAWVEFANRLVNAVITIASLGAVVAALARAPRRRDLTLLSLGLLIGLLVEVVLGALTVESGLAPGYVSADFLLAVVFLADAVVLHHRAGLPDAPPAGAVAAAAIPGAGRARLTGPACRRVGRRPLILARLLLVNASIVVVLGTVVTSTGPHGGAPTAPRYHLSLHRVAQLHGSSVEVFLVLTLLTLWAMARSGAPPDIMRRGEVLLAVLVVQGGIGYTQYLAGDPAGLVQLHIVGAVALIVAVLRFNLALTGRPMA